MVAGENYPVLQIRGRDIPQIKRFAVGNIHSEHLVEIAIKQFTFISHAQSVSAHQSIHSGGVKTGREQLEILIPFALLS